VSRSAADSTREFLLGHRSTTQTTNTLGGGKTALRTTYCALMMRLMRSTVFALALIDGIDCTNEVSLQQIEDLLSSSQCQDIYMDVGTNIGVQIRKMYEPHHYTGANMLVHFDKLFGPTPRCGVCTIGLEPNPRHSEKLHSLTQHLQAAGAGVIVLHGAALDRNGSINLQIDSDNSQWDLGASVLSEKSSNARMEQVPAFDLASLVSRMDRHVSRTGGSLMMKMDVEGAEDLLIPHLINSRRAAVPGQSLICAIDEIYIEWHHENTALKLPKEARESIARLNEQVKLLFEAQHGAKPSFLRRCNTKVFAMDDETFGLDGADLHGNGAFPLPTQPICPRRSRPVVGNSNRETCHSKAISLSKQVACEELKREDLFGAEFRDNCIHSDCRDHSETLPVHVAGEMSIELSRLFDRVGSKWGRDQITQALARAVESGGTIRGATLFTIVNNQSRCMTENYLIHLSTVVRQSNNSQLTVMLFCEDSPMGHFCQRLREAFRTSSFGVECIVPKEWNPPHKAGFKDFEYNRITYLRQVIAYTLLLLYKQQAALWNDIDYVWRQHPSLLLTHILAGTSGAVGAGIAEDQSGRINGGLGFFSFRGINYLRRWISRVEPHEHADQDHEPLQIGRIALGNEEDVHSCKRGAGLYAQHFTCCDKLGCMMREGVWKAGKMCGDAIVVEWGHSSALTPPPNIS